MCPVVPLYRTLRSTLVTADSLPRTPPPAGRLFRAGCPAKASQEEVLLLRRELRVQQMIDFRWGGWGGKQRGPQILRRPWGKQSPHCHPSLNINCAWRESLNFPAALWSTPCQRPAAQLTGAT